MNDPDLQRYHERLAEDGLAFMQAESDCFDLTLALLMALSWIAKALDNHGISYAVRSRLRTHGVLICQHHSSHITQSLIRILACT